MKSFFYNISVLVALSLVSCNEDPDIVDIIGDGNKSAIALSAGVAQTKGAELIDASFTSFYLYTYDSSGSLYFEDTVTRDPSDASCIFGATEPHPWPTDTSLTPLTFYGYYPYDGITPQSDEDGDMYVAYTSPHDAKDQNDFVVTSKSSDAASSVHLEFDHALSKIKFTLALNNDEVNIKDVKLYYSYKQLANQANYYLKSGVWSDLGVKSYSSDYQFDAYDCDAVNSTHTYSESLFVIPQEISSSEYLSVYVEYSIYNGNVLNHTVRTGDLALVSSESLGNTLAEEWKSGYEYTYNLSINTKNEMSFSLTVDSREDLTAQGNIDLQYISSYDNVTDRIKTLWGDGVKDIVIAGEYSSGKLGYGSVSCPFITGFGDEYSVTYRAPVDGETATHVYDSATDTYSYASSGETAEYVKVTTYTYSKDENGNEDTRPFSVDFRLMTNLPTFAEMHGGEPENTGDSSTDIDGTAPSFPKYFFQYAERLGEVILPADVIAIGDFAFQGCKNLETINMFGAKHVEQCSFQGCTNLKSVITTGSDGTLTRIHLNGFDGCISLSTINLGNIREIDDYGFVNCASLGETDLSNVTTVGKNAFDGCTNLDIPKGTDIPNLEIISDYAFAKCEKLGSNTDIVINEAVTIGDFAFNGCKALHLGDAYDEYNLAKIETVGRYAFQECSNIKDIDISNVTTIGEYAFYKCDNLKLANNTPFSNLRHINASAFHNCPVLCSTSPITITASQIETLGSMAFHGCSDFDFVGTEKQNFSALSSIESNIFCNCEKLDNPLEFTNSNVTSIGARSFSGCTLLPSVTINPDNIISIGDNAFYNCSAMTAFEFKPEIITYLGAEAFHSSPSLQINSGATLTFSVLDKVNENTFYGCSSMSNRLVFSNNLTSIDSSAFASSGITSITGLDKVAYLGEKVFQDCLSLTGTLSLPSVTSLSWQWNVFYNCTQLTSIELGLIEGKLGGGGTFQGCTNLTSIKGLDNVTEVPSNCFNGCASLSSLSLPSATTIDKTALSSCTSLTTFVANSLSGALDNALLSDCKTSLTTLELNGITELSYQAFSAFSNLKTISLDSVTVLGYGVFYDCTSLEELSLPKFSGALDLTRLFQIPDDCTTTPSSYALTTLDLPLVTSISNATLYLAGMPYLTTLNLPSLNSYSYGTLGGLTELTHLDLSCATLNMVESNDKMLFGSAGGPAENQCTLVLNEKYKTSSDDYTYVMANETGEYTGVTWMGIVWKEVIFVSE